MAQMCPIVCYYCPSFCCVVVVVVVVVFLLLLLFSVMQILVSESALT